MAKRRFPLRRFAFQLDLPSPQRPPFVCLSLGLRLPLRSHSPPTFFPHCPAVYCNGIEMQLGHNQGSG